MLGEYYASDRRPVFQALWEEFARCEFVAPDKEGETTFWYSR